MLVGPHLGEQEADKITLVILPIREKRERRKSETLPWGKKVLQIVLQIPLGNNYF